MPLIFPTPNVSRLLLVSTIFQNLEIGAFLHSDDPLCFQNALMFQGFWENFESTSGNIRDTAPYWAKKNLINFSGKSLDLLHENKDAHESANTCMALIVDQENNAMLLTGSFDRCVKIWSTDGQLRRKIDANFVSKISSICYSPRTRTIWIAQVILISALYCSLTVYFL